MWYEVDDKLYFEKWVCGFVDLMFAKGLCLKIRNIFINR